MECWKGVETTHRFFSGTGPSYDLIANLCTFGFDFWWKRKILRKLPPHPNRILDQASGTGILTFRIARRFPHCHVMGVELREEYWNIARTKAATLHLGNTEFLLGRAEDVVLQAGLDAITSSYLAKYADLGTLVSHAKEMLRPGGILILHDFTFPPDGFFLRLWKFYFKMLRGIGTLCFPEWKNAFRELPAFLESTRWLDELVSCLRETGFADIRVERLFMKTAALVTAIRPGGHLPCNPPQEHSKA